MLPPEIEKLISIGEKFENMSLWEKVVYEVKKYVPLELHKYINKEEPKKFDGNYTFNIYFVGIVPIQIKIKDGKIKESNFYDGSEILSFNRSTPFEIVLSQSRNCFHTLPEYPNDNQAVS